MPSDYFRVSAYAWEAGVLSWWVRFRVVVGDANCSPEQEGASGEYHRMARQSG